MAILPTRILEWEFDAGVWTDISADLVAVGTQRGRNRELGRFDAGQAVLTLRNDTRKYDPENAAGFYYGKLRPDRRIRFKATYNAVTYAVFQGYVDRIVQQYGGPNDATAEVAVSDLFKVLGRAELPSSVWVAEVAADSPVAWWRLGEPSGSTSLLDNIGGRVATVNGAPSLGAAGLVTRDSDGAMQTTADGPGAAYSIDGAATAIPGASAVATAYPITLSAIVKYTGSGSHPGAILTLVDNARNVVAQLYYDGSAAVLTGRNAAGGQAGATSAASINDGNPHLVSGVWNAAGSMQVYVDGVASGSPASLTGALNPAVAVWIGGGQSASGGTQTGFIGVIDELAVFTTAVAAARIAAWAAARAIPWNGDTPGTRLGRILDLAAVPAADRNLDAGNVTLQSTSLGGDALSYAQKIEETELGELFVTKDGKVRLLGRNQAVAGAYLTPVFTLVDADSGVAGIAYRQGGTSEVAEDLIVTRSTVSRDGSVAVQFYDAAAKTEFGWLDDTHSGLFHDNDAYSLYYAQWMVNSHKTPTSHIGALIVDPAADPVNAYPALLGLEIGDRVTYKRKPQNTGAVISTDMRVEAIAHETGAGYWTTRLQLAPFDTANNLPVFVWDVTKWDQHVWGL